MQIALYLMGALLLLAIASQSLAESKFQMQFGVRTPMRDGSQLVSDVWLPKEPGRYPSLLVRMPYMKSGGFSRFLTPLAQFYVEHGYVFVVQDTRGRGDSEGEFDFQFTEGKDGYDTIEWVAAQPWSNGKVGMLGVSYLGTVQWLAAREQPPHLVCIAPTAPGGLYMDELPYQGGAFKLQFALQWLNSTSDHSGQGPNTMGLDMAEIFKHRPLITLDEAFGRRMRLYREFLQHDTLDDYWKRIQFDVDDFKKLNIPTLTTTGWFDGDQPGALFHWRNMRAHSPAKDNQYLIVGPWTHLQTFIGGERKLGDFEFSTDAIYDLRAAHLAFFDHFMKNSTSKLDLPRARIYVTGSNKWREEPEYPLAAAQVRALYFRSSGNANTLTGDGRLTWEAPPRKEPPDRYTYLPENPVPSAAGESEIGTDQRTIGLRTDVLVYTSDKLRDPVEVIGNVVVHLFAATNARDTDFTARLLDVLPDGRALKLGPVPVGIIRARYRHSRERTELLTPGKTERYKIDLFDIAHTFLRDHRIRVEISSSYAPEFNPNSNTGNPVATDTESRPAKQTIFHHKPAASYVALPVMPNL